MKRLVALVLVAVPLVFGIASGQTSKPKTDTQIKQEIIKASIASYQGNSPCPYNTDRAGRRCGARSAYSRPGGASPMCFENDVTQKMLEEYRKKTKQETPAAKQQAPKP